MDIRKLGTGIFICAALGLSACSDGNGGSTTGANLSGGGTGGTGGGTGGTGGGTGGTGGTGGGTGGTGGTGGGTGGTGGGTGGTGGGTGGTGGGTGGTGGGTGGTGGGTGGTGGGTGGTGGGGATTQPFATAGQAADVTTLTTTQAGVDFASTAGQTGYAISGGSVTPTTTNGAATIQFVDGNTIDLTVNGTSSTLTKSGTGSFGGQSGTLFTDGSTDLILATSDNGLTTNSLFFGYAEETGGSVVSDTFLVSGFQTDPTELAGLAVANYQGPAYMIFRKANATDVAADKFHVIQDANGTDLTADFAAGTVVGTIQGNTTSRGGLGGGQMVFDVDAIMSGNSFLGTVAEAASSTSALNATGGAISGNFYGVDAAELGGTFSTDIAAGGGAAEDSVATGYFTGLKQ